MEVNMTNTKETLIICNNLALGYDGKAVIENLNFEVNEGDYLCIIGENGTGKSTLIKTLLNLIKPMSGIITTGKDWNENEIGYLPQQTELQKDFPASVWEVVLSGTLSKCGYRPFYSKKEKLLAEENIKKMDIWNLRKKCYRNLSGGQQQRVLLARALCATTNLILLDEPTAGLDPKASTDLYNVVQKLNLSGITVIMVSHDIKASIKYASHILHMGKHRGFFGKKDDYLKTDLSKLFFNLGGSSNE